MSKSAERLAAAEARVVAARQQLSDHVDSLKATIGRKARSPYVIGGAAIGAVGAAYLLYHRLRKPRQFPVAAQRNTGSLASLLTTLQVLAPLIAPVVISRTRPASVKIRPQPQPMPAAVKPAIVNPARPALPGPAASVRVKPRWHREQWQMIREAVRAWFDDYAPSMGAALSYYTLFSFAPLLILVIAVAGMIFGQEAAQGEIVAQMRGLLGDEGAIAIEGMLVSAREPAHGAIATIIGILTLLIGSTAVFSELQSALDRIWRSPVNATRSGIWHLLRTRLLSFGLVLGLGFLLMVSLVVSAALAALGKWWGGGNEGWDLLLEGLNFLVSFGTFTLLFAMIYKIMPSVKISWHDVWTGAAVTALLLVIGKVLIGLYLGRSSIASGFGAAGSLVVLVLWVYYSAQVFLLGAEYTWVYAHRCGSRMSEPAPPAPDRIPSRSE